MIALLLRFRQDARQSFEDLINASIGHLAKAYFVLASVSRAAGDWKQAREAVARAVTLWRTVNDASVLALHRPAKEEAEAMLREMAGSSP